MKIFSANQIRLWDEYTIHHEPISSLDLMERAANRCTEWLLKNIPQNKTFKIFCGKGNNGGDGLAIARLLAQNKIATDVYIIEFGNTGTPDFQSNLSALHHVPVRIHFLQHQDFLPSINENDIVIDAMLGTGLKRPLDGLYKSTVEHINKARTHVIAIDIPTGLSADKVIGDTIIRAATTLTFQTLKLAFLLPENEINTGQIEVIDIGLHTEYEHNTHSIYQIAEKANIKKIIKTRKKFSHKGNFGHALIVSGSTGKCGAAILCSRACLKTGAGLVTTVLPHNTSHILNVALPEAMTIEQRKFSHNELSLYITIGMGPGLGTELESAEMLYTLLANYNKPVVADADALNIFAADKALLNELPPGSILTPHIKEFERLFGLSNNHLERLQKARYYAQKLFVYIIIKGHYSAIACPDGEVYFNNTGNAGMATAGSGDVLTGILTGLLSQGYAPKDACLLGLHLHGLAGDIAAQRVGEQALIATDIIENIGAAYLSLLKETTAE